MSQRRIGMQKIREILRLKWECGLSLNQIASSCKSSKTAVRKCLRRAEAVGLKWPLPAGMDDIGLERQLYPAAPSSEDGRQGTLPAWSDIHMELKKKGVTLRLLWEEYKERQPGGIQYSWFCELYDLWRKKERLSMRQIHKAGEKLFVDYAGKTIPIINPETGKTRQAEIFVAVWGASNFTFAEAVWSQELPSWISSHTRAFEYFRCVPEITVPDNLKSGVTKACRYDPDLNPTYRELSAHYGFAIIPARARHPKDKAKVEAGVQLVTRWILAALRNRKFFSLDELNSAIKELLERLNSKPFQKMPGSRRSLFETLDRPAAKALPETPYVYAEILRATINIDYHIVVDDHFYSAPYQLRGERVIVRLTENTVEILFKNKRIFTHHRSYKKWGYTTIPEHMPEAHRKHLEWTPSRIMSWAESIGPSTANVVKNILEAGQHPEQGYRGCLGIFRLGKQYGNARIEDACKRASVFEAYRYKHVKSILERGLDNQNPGSDEPAKVTPIHHENIRGNEYYHQFNEEKGAVGNDQCDNGETKDTSAAGNAQSTGGTNGDDGCPATFVRGAPRKPDRS